MASWTVHFANKIEGSLKSFGKPVNVCAAILSDERAGRLLPSRFAAIPLMPADIPVNYGSPGIKSMLYSYLFVLANPCVTKP
ncbi:MAG: hypothetical protein U0Q16_18420 [Bryobacteraceae bacterium]